jgi:hypothetical protein
LETVSEQSQGHRHVIPLAAATGVVMATSLLVLVASAAAPAAIEAALAAAGIGHKPFGHKP